MKVKNMQTKNNSKFVRECQKTKGTLCPKICVYGVKQAESLEHDECFDCEHKIMKGKDLFCTGGFK